MSFFNIKLIFSFWLCCWFLVRMLIMSSIDSWHSPQFFTVALQQRRRNNDSVFFHSIPILLTDTDLPFVLLHCCPPALTDLTAFRKYVTRRAIRDYRGLLCLGNAFSCGCWDSDKRSLSPYWERDKRKLFCLPWDRLMSPFLLYFECGLAGRIMRNSQAPGWHCRAGDEGGESLQTFCFYPQLPVVFFSPSSNTTCLIDKQHSDLPLLQRQMIWFSEIRGKKEQENIFGWASHFTPKSQWLQ